MPRRSQAAVRSLGVLVLAAALVAQVGPGAAAVSATRRPPQGIAAAGAELTEGNTGRQLWGRQQNVQRPIASITKLMTALVVVEAGDLSRRIRITWADRNYVVDNGASNAGLKPGNVLTARELLYAMLLPSGADAAMALADSYGPGAQAFVRKMNATARRLHMRRTHFTNFDGLQSTDVSTPVNLIALGEAAMRQPIIRDVVGRRWYRLPAARHNRSYLWKNTNLLLRRYPGVIGIKTGWTPVAGECLLFEAVHRKQVLIGVVLDSAPTQSNETFVDAARLLNWGFGLNEPVVPAASFGAVPGD